MNRWDGIRRKSSIVTPEREKAHYVEGASLRVLGELRRRPGFAAANFGPLGAAVYGLMPANPSGGPFIIGQRPDGTFEGFGGGLAQWGNMQLLAPTGSRGYSSGIGDDSLGPYTHTFTLSDNQIQNPEGGPSGLVSGGANPGHLFEVTHTINVSLLAGNGGMRFSVIVDNDVGGVPAWDDFSETVNAGNFFNQFDDVTFIASSNVGAGVHNFSGTVVYRCSGSALNHFSTAAWFYFGQGTLSGTWDTDIVDLNGGPDGPVTYQPVIYRTDDWVTSFDLYALNGAWPLEPGMGRFVENVPIAPGVPFATASLWTPNGIIPSDWRFIAVARRGSLVGPFARLTN